MDKVIADIMEGIEATLDGRGDWFVDDELVDVRVVGDTICVSWSNDDEEIVRVRRFRLVEVNE